MPDAEHLHIAPDAARPALRTAMATASRTGQRELLTEASAMASVAETARGDHDCAVQLIQTARAAVDGLGYPAGRLALLQAQALHGFAAGDLETVRAVAAEGAELARADGDLYALGMMTRPGPGPASRCCCSSRDWSRSPPNLPVPHWEHRDSRPGSLPDGS
jgi:hypothetical protein